MGAFGYVDSVDAELTRERKVTMTKPNAGVIEYSELAATLDTKVSFKKPYKSPCLKMYGTIQAMTQAVGRGGSNDGGHGWRHRTH
jgi:hypothetical protein